MRFLVEKEGPENRFRTILGPDHVQVFWKHKCFGNISQLETRPLIG